MTKLPTKLIFPQHLIADEEKVKFQATLEHWRTYVNTFSAYNYLKTTLETAQRLFKPLIKSECLESSALLSEMSPTDLKSFNMISFNLSK